MQTITTDTEVSIPPTVKKCPICKASLTVEIDEWEQDDDGTWYASETGVHCSCSTEPDMFEGDDWEDWFDGHFSMPYVDWMPVDQFIYRWLKRNYRFEMREKV